MLLPTELQEVAVAEPPVMIVGSAKATHETNLNVSFVKPEPLIDSDERGVA